MSATPDTEFIVACLQKRCSEISLKPTEKPCNGLVAFQDGLTFTANDVMAAVPLFNAGVEAIKARFKFARMNYEGMFGASVIFAEEFIVMPQVDNEKNIPTGSIDLRAQIVLKSLTSGAPSLMDEINGKA